MPQILRGRKRSLTVVSVRDFCHSQGDGECISKGGRKGVEGMKGHEEREGVEEHEKAMSAEEHERASAGEERVIEGGVAGSEGAGYA